MIERPILFSAPMVRAILSGTKTQTRRVIKDQAIGDKYSGPCDDGRALLEWLGTPCCGTGVWDVPEYSAKVASPYGLTGDRLWVRETFSGLREFAPEPPSAWGPNDPIWYWADGNPTDGDWTKPRPSIHMPRFASRITLEITGVRVERLQAINHPDARAEGCTCYVCGGPLNGLSESDCDCFHRHATPNDFRHLWESINGPGSWDANPWVWVVEFKRVEA